MSKSIAQIRAEFENAQESEWSSLYEKYETDERAGVQSVIQKYQKKEQSLRKERERLIEMRKYEEQYKDCKFICGILFLNDSKKLSAAKREELYDEIMEKAVAVGVGMASPARIDEINILQATYEAMRTAVSELGVEPDILLNDAVTIPEITIPQVPIIKGDAKSVSIAAASIIAKVTRDRLMVQYEEVLPGYGFAKHKGYGSKEHIEAIRRLGPTPIHRRTFIKNFI